MPELDVDGILSETVELEPTLNPDQEKQNLNAYRNGLFGVLAGAFALALIAISYSAWYQFGEFGTDSADLPFTAILYRPDTLALALEMLAALAIVATLMERVVEVYVSTSRADRRQLQVQYIDHLKARLEDASLDNNQRKAITTGITKGTTALIYYRTNTKVRAKAFAIIVGTLIALAGVRGLTPILSLNYDTLNVFQWFFIQLVDIILTVGLLVGGSSGIHKIISALGRQAEGGTRSETAAQTQP